MKKNETSVKQAAKAGLCAGIAGVTALSGAAPALALADAPQSTDAKVIRAAEDAPQTVEQAKLALDVAKTHVDDTAAARDAARDLLAGATSAREELSNAASEANRAALDDELAVAGALDAINASASAAIVDATASANDAQAAFDSAVAGRDAARDDLEAAKAALQEAQSAYDAALSNPNIGDATETESVAIAAYDEFIDVANGHDELQNAFESASAELEGKTAAYSAAQARLDQAQIARDGAASQLESSKQALSEAQARIDVLDEEAARVDAQISAAQASLSAAQTALSNANNAVTAAEGALNQASSELSVASAAYETAKANFNTNLASYKQKQDDAKADWDDAVAYTSQLGNDAAAEQAVLDELEAALEHAKEQVAAAQTAYDDAEAALKRAEERLESGEGIPVDTRDYFKEQVYNAGDEINYDAGEEFSSLREANGVQYPEVTEATDPTATGDATQYENILRSLDSIKEFNALREKLGLSELLILDTLMAREIVNLNWAALPEQHAPGAGRESIAWGDTSLENAWYWSQKHVYDEAVSTSSYEGVALPDGWQAMSSAELAAASPAFYAAVSSYLNCIDPTLRYVGAAVNTAEGVRGGFAIGQVYSATKIGSEDALDVEMWESKFVAWVNRALENGTDAEGALAYSQAKTLRDAAKNALDEAINTREIAQNDCNIQRDDFVTPAQKRLSEANDQCVALYQRYQEAKATYDKALETSQSEDELISAAKETYDAAYARYVTAHEALLDKQAAVIVARNGFNVAGALVTQHRSERSRISAERNECDITISDASEFIKIIEENLGTQDLNIAIFGEEVEQLAVEHSLLVDSVSTLELELETAKVELAAAEAALYAAEEAHGIRLDANAAVEEAALIVSYAAEAIDFAEFALLEAGDEVLRAEAGIMEARQALSDAIAAFEQTNDMTVDEALAQEFDNPALTSVKAAVERLEQSREAARNAAVSLEAAESRLDEAEAAYQLAHDDWSAALAAAADAQVVYDRLLAAQSVDQGDQPSSTPTVPDSGTQATPSTPAPSGPSASGTQQSGPVAQDPAGDQQQSQPTIADVANEPGPSGSGSVVSYQQPAAPAAASYSNGSASAYPRFAVSTPVDEVEAVYDEPIVDEAQTLVEESIADDGTPLAIPVAEEDNSVAGIAGGVSIAVVVGAGAAVASMKLRRRRNNS